LHLYVFIFFKVQNNGLAQTISLRIVLMPEFLALWLFFGAWNRLYFLMLDKKPLKAIVVFMLEIGATESSVNGTEY
jgi:hypothetical protein